MAPDLNSNLLILGCGNSALGEELATSGFTQIHNIDISKVAIDHMRKRNVTHPGLTYDVMDVRHLLYDDESIDLVIDKGTMDALFCGPRADLNVARMTREVQRVVKTGGHYIVVSYGDPEMRMSHLTSRHLVWEVTYESLPDEEGPHPCHYVYSCKKTRLSQESLAAWISVETELSTHF
jgi:ubiquinone/menaquinone biosynthesis C-methylase UbiE